MTIAAENQITNTIEHKYIEVGHCQMDVDSVHSMISREIKRRGSVNHSADPIYIVKLAKKEDSKYEVKGNDLMGYPGTFFKDYKSSVAE